MTLARRSVIKADDQAVPFTMALLTVSLEDHLKSVRANRKASDTRRRRLASVRRRAVTA